VDPILCFPDPAPAEALLAITEVGYPYACVASAIAAEAEEQRRTELGWSGAVVVGTEQLAEALAVCRSLRKRESPVAPLLLVVDVTQLDQLSLREDLFDDFVLAPLRVPELTTRLRVLLDKQGRGTDAEVIEYGPLQINLATYQAAIAGRVLDLTYMEYELLRFLASHPTKVFTRETLLSRVWGYEYYGGARTVDVHIRRLRAKLGETHAHLIQTVRSVGYRFGAQGWTPS
jgi:DNA-binding response OmpR family regulator